MISAVELKPGAKVEKLTVPMLLGFFIAQRVYQDHGVPCVITSGNDGQHSKPNSLHYSGNALDLRLPSRFAGDPHLDVKIVAEMKKALNAPITFDVVLESGHIHVEFDPKGA